jgi:AcrR family transcriptional regulator
MAKRNPKQTKENILQAAIAEFAGAGFGGARVDRIAEQAGANKRMIYHYFGNKEGLYQAVFLTLYSEIREHEMSIDLDPQTPIDTLVDLAVRTFDFFVGRPEFIRILNNENLLKARSAEGPGNQRNQTASLIARIDEVLRAGEARGEVRSGIDAIQLYVSIAALGYFYLSNSHTLGLLFSRDLLSSDAINQRRAHIRDSVRAMLQP